MDESIDKVTKSFLNGLRISLGNASIYSAEHPVFLKSLDELMRKLDEALISFKSIEIFIAPRYLIIDQKKLEKDSLYEDLARFFHIRSVKSVKIERGVTVEELNFFLSKVAMRPRDILEEGGMTSILKEKNIVHVFAEMLDYTEILKSTKEDKDVWAYLLRKAIEDENLEEIDAIIGNFNRMFRDVGVKNLMESEEFRKGVEVFLAYLQPRSEEAFSKCLQYTLEALVRDKSAVEETPLPESFINFFKTLDAKALSEVLFEQILFAETSDFVVLKLYEQFVDEEIHKAIARFISDKIEQRTAVQINLAWLEKINDLFSGAQQDIIHKVYQPIIIHFKEKFEQEDIFHFERDQFPYHFRATLLNLFAYEQGEKPLTLIVERIIQEWEGIDKNEKLRYYQSLLELRENKKDDNPTISLLLARIDDVIAHYIEECILAGEDSPQLEYFINVFKEGVLGSDRYLDRMFEERDVRPFILRSFFKFYPNDLKLFYERLKKKISDTSFILAFLENMVNLDSLLRLEILKRIFASPNPYIKIEVLKRMGALPLCDRRFLFSILSYKGSDPNIRQYSLLVLMKDAQLRKESADILLSKAGPFGKDKVALVENIRVVGNMKLIEAEEYLKVLSKRRFFWNRKLRKAALTVLKEWGNGDN